MSRFFRNRKSNEIRAYLEAHGYKLVSRNGDDDIYAKDGYGYTVKIPNRNEVIPNGTMDSIKRMIVLNGTTRKNILNWWKENGFGD